MIESMVTTVDNPYNPFDDFDSWYAFDEQAGYHTSSFLARIVVTSPSLSEADDHRAIELAVDEIVRENVLGMYRKVTREVPGFTDEDISEEVNHSDIQTQSDDEELIKEISEIPGD